MRTEEEKVQLVKKWFSDDEINQLNSLRDVKEESKVSNVYPNLYTQVANNMIDIASSKEDIYEKMKELNFDSGDFVCDAIIKSIYDEFIAEFTPYECDEEEASNFTAKAFRDFACNTYSKIEAAKILREVFKNFHRINDREKLIELANSKVLW